MHVVIRPGLIVCISLVPSRHIKRTQPFREVSRSIVFTKMNGNTHLAALLYGAKDLRLQQVPTSAPLPHQVQIQPRATGICGTDMHYYAAGKNGMFVVRTPLVLGHEAVGEVIAVGKEVSNVRVGDRVAIEPQRPCGECKQCITGLYNLCSNMKFSGSASANPPVQGSLQQIYCHAADFVHKLPETVEWIEGAIIEPLAVAVHAVKRSGLEDTNSILVLGAGAIGLLCAAVARSKGINAITMVDVDSARLEFARSQRLADSVFTMPLRPNDSEDGADFCARIATEITSQNLGSLFETVYECTGVETCVNVGIHAASPRGKVVLVGMGSPTQNVRVGSAAIREIDLISVWRYANTFGTAIDLIASGQVTVKPLVTHVFQLEQAADALDVVVAKPPDLIKCVIVN